MDIAVHVQLLGKSDFQGISVFNSGCRVIIFLGKPCLNNCYEENEQGTCNTTTGICACNPDQPKYKFCGPDCNIMYQHCVIYCKNNPCPDWVEEDEYAYLLDDY